MKFSRYNLEVFDPDAKKTILFNTLSGHSFYITDEVCESIRSQDVAQLDDETLQAFQKCGIVVDDTVDERRIVSYFHGKAKFSADAVSSTVLLTWACNFACIYCYEGAGTMTETMSDDQADRYIMFMKNEAERRRPKTMYVNLFGGEPLMNIGRGLYILEELSSYCAARDIAFSCGVITNGTLLDEETIKKLLTFNCSMVQITLDGLPETHNARRPYKGGRASFDDVIAAIKRLILHPQIRTVIRINVDKTNLLETEKLLEYIGKQNENLTQCSVDFGIVRGSTKACSSYSENCLLDSEIGDTLSYLWTVSEANGSKIYSRPYLRWMYCGLYADSQFTITPDCGVFKCWEHAGMEEHKMGELDANGNIINVKYAFFDWMSKTPIEDSECRECVYLPSCGGGCGAVSYNKENSYHAKGCFKIKGVLEQQIIRFAIETMQAKK